MTLRPLEDITVSPSIVDARQPSRPGGDMREALVLPAIFLTVALLGGFRPMPSSGGFRFLAPPLMTLVLATLLLSVLVSGRVLVPQRLMNPRRGAIDNLTGAFILLTLFAAAAQLFNLVTPEAGALRIAFDIVFFVLLANTAAAARHRPQVLRSIVIIFGAAFILKFLVLAALQGPGGGVWYRVVALLFEGVTQGSFAYPDNGPATGYVAFFTIALFLAGLVLLPAAEPDHALVVRRDQSDDSIQ